MKNRLTQEEIEQLDVLRDKKHREFLKEFILTQTEAQISDKFSDENLDKEVERRKLLQSIYDFWKIKDIGSNVLRKPSDYKKIFSQEFYKEIFRLHSWPIPESISKKPWVVGRFTNEIIYYRFSQEVLPFLRIINPYIVHGKRSFKHHQYLTPGARIKLKQFIDEATEEMKKHSDWNSFRVAYCAKYNVPYQLKFTFPGQ